MCAIMGDAQQLLASLGAVASAMTGLEAGARLDASLRSHIESAHATVLQLSDTARAASGLQPQHADHLAPALVSHGELALERARARKQWRHEARSINPYEVSSQDTTARTIYPSDLSTHTPLLSRNC